MRLDVHSRQLFLLITSETVIISGSTIPPLEWPILSMIPQQGNYHWGSHIVHEYCCVLTCI